MRFVTKAMPISYINQLYQQKVSHQETESSWTCLLFIQASFHVNSY